MPPSSNNDNGYRREDLKSEESVRNVVRGEFRHWARFALPPHFVAAPHQLLLMDRLRDVCDGRCDRLMVLMPPGSAKSTYGSVLFPPYWFSRNPGSQVIACSHTASLAGEFGSRVRGLIAEHTKRLGYRLGARRCAHDFRLSCGGSYFAVGVQGGVTGRRADLIVIDDPVKSHAEADSAAAREHLWNWYRSDLLTRLKPGGRVVLIMTRWHEDDLGGRLLNSGEAWSSLRLPAHAEAADALGRAPGEALWPEWECAAQLERKRAMLGERQWAALYQQAPRPPGETLFKVSAIEILDQAAPVQMVRAWDLAATAQEGGGDPDWTVGVKLGREASGRFVVLDVVRLRGPALMVENAITQAAEADGPGVAVHLPQDPGQAGKAQIRYLTSRLAGFRVHASPETGAKTTRAMPLASQIEAGNFALLRAHWSDPLLEELRAFPIGRKDDQVDALSRAFAALTASFTPTRRLDAAFLQR